MNVNAESWRVRSLAGVTLISIACFVLSMGALHWLQPDLGPLDQAMSYYVHGSHGWLLTLGLLTLSLGSLALTIALGSRPGAAVSRGGNWCLGLWSVGGLLAALFPADPPGHWDRPPSVGGSIHGLAAMLALIIFPVASLLWSRHFRLDARWARLSGMLLVFAIASVVSLVAFIASLVPVFVRPGPPVLLGLTERILLAVYVAWLAVVSVGLLKFSVSMNSEPDVASKGGSSTASVNSGVAEGPPSVS
jgi:Protein of unknown function (DUF998)